MAFIVGLWAVCLGLIVGARAVGRSRPTPDTYLDSGNCAQPCWQGIRPGEIAPLDLRARVGKTGSYAVVELTDYGDRIARNFGLRALTPITLGDVVRAFGVPDRVACLRPRPQSAITGASIYFAEGLVVVEAANPASARLSPDMRVESIFYYSPGLPAYRIGSTAAWGGFAGPPVYRVCQR
jgi:hypothetical protein